MRTENKCERYSAPAEKQLSEMTGAGGSAGKEVPYLQCPLLNNCAFGIRGDFQ
jgi:hypothetical protein